MRPVSKHIWVNTVAHKYLVNHSPSERVFFVVDLYQVDYTKSTLLILALWTFSGAASNLLMEANMSLNDFWERDERKLTRYSLPYSFCACAIGKSSSSSLILLRVRNSETSKLLRSANLVGFVVVDTWLPDVSVDRDFRFCLIACTFALGFWDLIFCMLGLRLRKNIWVTSGDIFERAPVIIMGIWKMILVTIFFVHCVLYRFPTFWTW